MTSSASLAHLVYWDVEFNRPVVDGKIIHPITGEIQQAGAKGLRNGPPGIHIRIFNINSSTNVAEIAQFLPVPVEQIYLGVAQHIQDGIYSIVSINITSYAFFIICEVKVSAEAFRIAWKNLLSKKEDYKYADEEWDAAYLDQIKSENLGNIA
jgi:hypothetical protein